ncbi:DMT family transporter [Clostridium coskatii]|uniref:Inner membrane transporter YhbE n=1 Tax=Clostridium coskatii TaxID=1705578 RepID=A0A168R744_9CLOT|nr:DMT family transporter [Clostridium coskatii]OAA90134.1 putative inner membrane transporter YhbE [Clostridium coskatii]OBR97431.1 putative inner membrane transporter YhbE [Clostridium coskatii]
MKKRLIGSMCLFLAACIWGGMYVVSKYILEFISPITLVWIRYAIAFVVLFLILMFFNYKKGRKVVIKKKDWLLIAWIGFIGYFISICLQFMGTKLSDAHMGSLITASTPVFVIIFARFILKELFTKKKIISLILATFGVIIVIGLDSMFMKHLLGNIILVGAAVTWALASVYLKIVSKRFNSLIITTYAMLFALIFTTPLMLTQHNNFTLILNNRNLILGIIYLGVVSTAGAFFLWNKGIGLMDVGIGSLFLFFQPVTGSIFGWLYLHEQLTFGFFIGGTLIVIAVIIAITKEDN